MFIDINEVRAVDEKHHHRLQSQVHFLELGRLRVDLVDLGV